MGLVTWQPATRASGPARLARHPGPAGTAHRWLGGIALAPRLHMWPWCTSGSSSATHAPQALPCPDRRGWRGYGGSGFGPGAWARGMWAVLNMHTSPGGDGGYSKCPHGRAILLAARAPAPERKGTFSARRKSSLSPAVAWKVVSWWAVCPLVILLALQQCSGPWQDYVQVYGERWWRHVC